MAPKAALRTLVATTILLTLVTIILYNYHRPESTIIPQPDLRKDPRVVLYTKNGCIYCERAEQLLKNKKIPYEVVELTNNQDLIIKLVNQTGQNTVPFVFVDNEFIGGYQSLVRLDETGKF